MADAFTLIARSLTSTSTITLTTLGTASTALIRGLTFCNTSTSSSATVDLTVTKSGSTTGVYMFRGVAVAAQATSQPLSGTPLVLNAGDSLSAKASAANQIDATLSYLETS
jgi:hypothetical protein